MTTPATDATLIDRYADLLIRIGVNLQPGQSLFLTAEIENAAFARRCVGAAYRAGARYVQLNWNDDLAARERLLHSRPEYLEYVPDYDVARARQAVDEGWARLFLAGPSAPSAFEEIAPTLLRRAAQARQRRLKFFSDAYMANQIQWSIGAVPTRAWAQQVYPELDAEDHDGNAAVARLWDVIFTTVRLHEDDPIAAWQAHDARLSRIARFLMDAGIRALHFSDPTPGRAGKPRTDLMVGLTDAPVWVAASSATPAGVRFLPNMPTEEIFTTPHCLHTEGWVTTTKPGFPFDKRVDDAWFRFERGEVVEHAAAAGQDALDEFLQVPGAQRLGEIALVDVRSPVNASGTLFYETLFDENCVCHMALGQAYPEGVEHGSAMTDDEKAAAGINQSETHVDFMIGSESLAVDGITADGRALPIMRAGRFVEG